MTLEQAEMVPIGELIPHPDNPRRSDVDWLAEGMKAHGWYGTIAVQRSTKHILAGNHRWRAAKENGLKEIPVWWMDVGDEEAKEILAWDNRSSDLAENDDRALAALLEDIRGHGGLERAGFDNTALDDLLTKIAGPPDLDELAAALGDPTPADFWPTVRFKIPPGLMERYLKVVKDIDEGNRFKYLVECAER